MNVAIVGTDYQGLVVAACLADSGNKVTCFDADPARIQTLRDGGLPIHEPGLEELVARNIEEERLHFSTDLREAAAGCLLVFICVPTPTLKDGEADIGQVFAAVDQIAAAMDGYRIIVNKATCPPGTVDEIARRIAAKTRHPFDVIANPDFMKEGTAIDDFMRPDRVIVGCEDVRVREIMKELYSPYLRTGKPFLCMGTRSAEMTKYATNVMLAARISLMNQLADLCEACDASISEVREGVGSDERIGSTFLFPGIGFGGFGLPKDLATTIRLAHDKGVECDLIEAIRNVNKRRRKQFLQRILDHYGPDIAGTRIAIWGAAFKPRTDDIRNAPALRIIDGLLDAGAEVVVYDPVAAHKLREHYRDRVAIVSKYYNAIEGADGLVVVTEWNEFRRPDYPRMKSLMRQPVIFDARNIFTPAVMREEGFRYYSVGRPTV